MLKNNFPCWLYSYTHLHNIRDILGHIHVASAHCIRNPGSILATELLAILHGMSLAIREDFTNVLVFSDSLLAVQRLNSRSEMLNYEGSIVNNILEMVNSGHFLSFHHVFRYANKLAYALAHFALSSPSKLCWRDSSYTLWLLDVANSDLLHE